MGRAVHPLPRGLWPGDDGAGSGDRGSQAERDRSPAGHHGIPREVPAPRRATGTPRLATLLWCAVRLAAALLVLTVLPAAAPAAADATGAATAALAGLGEPLGPLAELGGGLAAGRPDADPRDAGGHATALGVATGPATTVPAVLALGGAVLLIGLGAYLGRRFAAPTARSVRALSEVLDRIDERSPTGRVPLPRRNGELRRLALSINRTLGRMQAALEHQQRFTSDASHDLRSPITAIRAEVEDALLAPDDRSVTELARTILGGIDRLQATVNDLLMIAQLDARVGGAATRVDLGELVGEELAVRRRSASDAATTIEYSHVPGLVIQADPVRLRRLITNLLDNAERHAASMVSVRVWYEPAINARSSGFAMLEVLDDGPGIAPDQRELVFQRFIRLDAARAKDSAGTGLGLAIARQIAEEAGGSLRILGSPRGARFVLALPAVHGAAGPPVEPGAPGLAAPGTPA